MLHVHSIDTLEHPQLAPYRTMRRQMEHRREGIFVAEGEKVVRRLLDSELTVVSLLLPEKWLNVYEPLLKHRMEEIHAFMAPKEQLETLTGFSMYQGVLAVGRIPDTPLLTTVLDRSPRPLLLAAVENISNAENLGALVRNCAAFGVHALLAGETCCSPWLRRAVRNSMGTVFRLPALEVPGLAATLRQLRERGVRCVAAHPHTDRRTLTQADFTRDCCIVFGSEGEGISAGVLAACDEHVAIPMHAGVDSLNVGAAAAVFLYEAARQRG